MKISFIAIGTELLIGQVTDTNSGAIARHIAPYGWEINDIQVIDDNEPDIIRAVERALATSDVVVTTGGLGPTSDDITKHVLTRFFGGCLVESEEVLENIRRIFNKRGFDLNRLTSLQAMVPNNCTVIQNRVGTAPIMWWERDGKVLVSMPGVPFETETMWKEEVFPRLLRHFPSDMAIAHATLLVTDYTESALAEYIADFERNLPEYMHLAYLPKQGTIRLRLDGKHPDADFISSEVKRHAAMLAELLGPAVIAERDASPAEILIDLAREKGLKIASAESCTGGNIAHAITAVPGASDVFNGAVVSYSNEVKISLLHVDPATIESLGAVSEPVAAMMAAGALDACGADIAVSTSGIAGPGGGTAEKPVGTVCMGVAVKGRAPESYTFRFAGDRSRIIDSATRRAIILAIKAIR
ncbi:MAG: CinA family nicotinamide mononucleotide deamidase-related protein [Duncaniella sp.]|nr:CinA family nicotinamide mononucleotide deamidase-related protein [Duncaniella sp.]